MTREEYEIRKKQIIDVYGQPEYDMNSPVNESAKRIRQLINEMGQEAKKEKKMQGRAISGPGMTNVEANEILKAQDTRKQLSAVDVPAIELEDRDLRVFDDKERVIVVDHFADLKLTNKQLARMHKTSTQYVTALLNGLYVKALEAKAFDRLMPLETRMALLAAIRSGQSAVTLRLAEHYSLISNAKTDINIGSKPIDDPEVSRVLRELGDRAANTQPKDNTNTPTP